MVLFPKKMQIFWQTANLNSLERKRIFHNNCFSPLLLGMRLGASLPKWHGRSSDSQPSALFFHYGSFQSGSRRHLEIGLPCIITFVVFVSSLVLSYLLLLLFLRNVVISKSVFLESELKKFPNLYRSATKWI